MTTEIEVPLEHLQEEIHHHAQHSSQRWFGWVALSSAFLAAFAAVSALLAGHHANEAMIEQIQASNRWSHYQAKSIKASLLSTKTAILEANGKPTDIKDAEKANEYRKEMDEISAEAKEREKIASQHLHVHEILARSVTLFQVSIAVSAIALLTKRRKFWYLSLGFGSLGLGFLIQGLLSH